MIVRIVTMTFKEQEIEKFLSLFNQYKSQIRAAEGCVSLTLIQNSNSPSEISTLSYWKNDKYLNIYRGSEIFKEVWPQTKLLFSAPPKAVSYDVLTIA